MAQKDPDAWTQQDAIALRTFIAANPKFLKQLQMRRPKIEGDTMEARAVTGSDVNGYFHTIDNIEALQRDPAAGSEDAGFISEENDSNQTN